MTKFKKYTVSSVFVTDYNMELPEDIALVKDMTARQVFLLAQTDGIVPVALYSQRDLEPHVQLILDEEKRQFNLHVSNRYTKKQEALEVMREMTKKINTEKPEIVLTPIILNRQNKIIYPTMDPDIAYTSGTFNDILLEIIGGLETNSKMFNIRVDGSLEILRVTYSQILFFLMGLCSKSGIKNYSCFWNGGINPEFVQEVIYEVIQQRPNLSEKLAKVGTMFIRKKEEGYSTMYSITGVQ